MTRVEFLTQTFSFLQPAARIPILSHLKLFQQRFKDISDKMSVLILPTTDNPNINVHLSVTKSVTLFESEDIQAQRALGKMQPKAADFQEKNSHSSAVTLLQPMRCWESHGKLGHKRTDMTQPMFWMSPIFSKRSTTMELIRAKSNVFYIPDSLTTAAAWPRCYCSSSWILHPLKTTFGCRSAPKLLHFQELVKNLQSSNVFYQHQYF